MSWPLVKLEAVSEFIRNGASIKQSSDAAGLPITRIETIADRSVNLDKCGYADVSESEYLNYRLRNGDILISHINSEKHLAKCAIFESDRRDIVHGMNLLCLRPRCEVVYPKYLFHYLSSPVFLKLIPTITKKSVNQASFTVTAFKDLEIPLPPLAEQKRIAAILDKADAIRRKRQQAIQLADDFLRAVFLDMFGDPVTNPKGWEVCRFEDLTSLVTYGLTVRPQYHEDGVPLISAREIRTGELDFESCPKISKLDFDKLSEKGRPKKNDILFSKTGSIGHCAIVRTEMDFAVTQNAARIAPNTDVCDPIFLLAFMRTKYFYNLANREAKGNAVKDLQLGIMKDFPMYLPPILLQKKFVELYSKAESLTEKVGAGSVLLHSNFNGLSQKAFSGQL